MKSRPSFFLSEVLILIGLLFMADNQNAIRLGQRKKKEKSNKEQSNPKTFQALQDSSIL